jgi:hypothetical protein
VASFTRDTHWIGGWVGPRRRLDDVERKKYSPYQDSNSEHRQSLYRQRYPGSRLNRVNRKKVYVKANGNGAKIAQSV